MRFVTSVKRLEVQEGRRLIAVSDVHAHPHLLVGLLQKVQFSGGDLLILVGDLLARGPDSLGALRYAMALCQAGRACALLGNVDAWLLSLVIEDGDDADTAFFSRMRKATEWYGSSFFGELCGELGLLVESIDDVPEAKREIRQAFAEELEFMLTLPTILETERFTFVHGGLPDGDIESLEGTNAIPYLKNDAFADKGICFDKYLVVGHWPASLYSARFPRHNPYLHDKQRIISIDGGIGIKQDGQLNALIIPGKDGEPFTFAAYDDLPKKTARADQAASEQSIYIKFPDNAIRVISREDSFSLVEHISSGDRLSVPNQFIYEEDGQTHCKDVTDYRVPVQKGDALSVVMETAYGTLVKKDGVTGWYDGELS